jgi:hypothetical protein
MDRAKSRGGRIDQSADWRFLGNVGGDGNGPAASLNELVGHRSGRPVMEVSKHYRRPFAT